MALPGADASNLTALWGGGVFWALLGNASEGRDVIVSTPLVPTPLGTPDVRARLNLNPARWGVRAITEIGVALALSAVLSWIAQAFPLRMPQGGSFGLEMLPILFIALRRGVVPGVVAGGLFGLLQLVGVGGAPYIYQPLQAALDYPLAFGALGLAGLVPVGELKGAAGALRLTGAVAVGAGARFVFHFLSGLIFFAEYAPKWEAPWLYSISYNLLYLLPSAVVTAIVLWPLLRAYDTAFPGPRRTGS
jgi:thiamine transporter